MLTLISSLTLTFVSEKKVLPPQHSNSLLPVKGKIPLHASLVLPDEDVFVLLADGHVVPVVGGRCALVFSLNLDNLDTNT